MSACSVPTIRAALVTAFADLGVPVFYGHPGQQIPDVYVAVADSDEAGVAREQHTLPLRRQSSRTEEYTLRVVVWSRVGDHDGQQAASETAWALVDQIDDLLRTDPTVGGVASWVLPSNFNDADFLLSEGRAAEIVVSLHVHVNRS